MFSGHCARYWGCTITLTASNSSGCSIIHYILAMCQTLGTWAKIIKGDDTKFMIMGGLEYT